MTPSWCHLRKGAGRDPLGVYHLNPLGQAVAVSARGGMNTDPLLKAVHGSQAGAMLGSQGAGQTCIYSTAPSERKQLRVGGNQL